MARAGSKPFRNNQTPQELATASYEDFRTATVAFEVAYSNASRFQKAPAPNQDFLSSKMGRYSPARDVLKTFGILMVESKLGRFPEHRLGEGMLGT